MKISNVAKPPKEISLSEILVRQFQEENRSTAAVAAELKYRAPELVRERAAGILDVPSLEIGAIEIHEIEGQTCASFRDVTILPLEGNGCYFVGECPVCKIPAIAQNASLTLTEIGREIAAMWAGHFFPHRTHRLKYECFKPQTAAENAENAAFGPAPGEPGIESTLDPLIPLFNLIVRRSDLLSQLAEGLRPHIFDGRQ